ncbi:MAG: hypothetical protein ACRCVU_20265 [Flavobacterium sp.]
MKPNWDSAPEWANYLTMDQDSTWWWHKNEPYIDGKFWTSCSLSTKAQDCGIYWKHSFEERNED